MKFRSSFLVFREQKDDGSRPWSAGRSAPSSWKMPHIREMKSSTSTLSNDATDQEDGRQTTPSRRAMRKFLQKTGANIRAAGANIRAKGSKIEERIPRKKSKAAKPPVQRDNQVEPWSIDISDEVLDKLMGPPMKEMSDAFFEDQQKRASDRKQSSSNVSLHSGQPQMTPDRKPLSKIEVQAMFAGAPEFYVQEDYGKYKPEIKIRTGGRKKTEHIPTDHALFGHPTFAASTLARAQSRRAAGRLSIDRDHESIREWSGVVEVPSMLTLHGLDLGTVGLEHYLQLAIADTTYESSDVTVSEKRKQLRSDPDSLGLRELNMEALVRRLNDIDELHTGIKEQQWESPAPWNRSKIEEMGENLFSELLSADLGTTGAGTGSVTLKTQIAALQKVLNISDLWHDFSIVEWRVRVGQLLWASDELEHDQPDEQPNERDVFILQITLAAELLIRLLALEALSSSFPPIIPTEDAKVLEKQRTTKTKWDLLLAECFLANLNIAIEQSSESRTKSNRASVLSMMTFFTAKETAEDTEQTTRLVISAKNETEQLAGLVHFAESIQWPHAGEVKLELESKLAKGSKERPISTAASVYATPLTSPKFPGTYSNRNSFFGFGDQQRRPGFSRTTTAQSICLWPARNIAGNIENFEVGGWLSRSWLSGFVMPGEPATHFLMSALLENSPQAITAIGEEANLYGGFVYEGRGFWSKSSVLGRVLAASFGAVECMGWVSVPESTGMEDGWIALDVKEAADASSKARIKDTEAVTEDSAPAYRQKIEILQAGDFTTPTDGPSILSNDVRCEGTSFTSAPLFRGTERSTSLDNDGVAMDAFVPSLAFASLTSSNRSSLTVPLIYDVHFISSYPCHPRLTKPRSGSRPMTPSTVLTESNEGTPTSRSGPRMSTPTMTGKVDSKNASKTGSMSTLDLSLVDKELPTLPGHPLHVQYQYKIVTAGTLLSTPEKNLPGVLSSTKERKSSNSNASEREVVVLDCRGSNDLELLARAWCAKIGESALVGRSGRTCLACCIREARALDVRVMIRT